MMSLGSYPMISLLEARQKRDSNKQLLSQGINPERSEGESREIEPYLHIVGRKIVITDPIFCLTWTISNT